MRFSFILAFLFLASPLFAMNNASRSSKTARNRPGDVPVFASKQPSCTISLRKTPLVRFMTAEMQAMNSKTSTSWPVMELKYTAKQAEKGEQNAIDNVRLDGMLVIQSQDANGKSRPAIFTGTVKIWTMNFDGTERSILMAVPPQLVNRYIQPGLDAKSSAIVGRFVLYNEKGEKIYEEYAGMNKTFHREDFLAIFEQIDSTPGFGLRIDGGFLPRSRTPWNLMDFTKYDIEKPDMPEMNSGKAR